MSGNGLQVDWLWLVFAAVVALIATAYDWEGKILRRRLIAGVLALWGAAALAGVAITGLDPAQMKPMKFSGPMLVGFRMLAALGALWTAYLGFDVLRTWWRIGDRDDDPPSA